MHHGFAAAVVELELVLDSAESKQQATVFDGGYPEQQALTIPGLSDESNNATDLNNTLQGSKARLDKSEFETVRHALWANWATLKAGAVEPQQQQGP